ncbi:MAG: hypothetical protein DWI57_11270 [Chloroflexi bacterium]|nr:MAG: hypothetical protein DWI57_11270 [Chloroflexota bacterium]
MRPVVEIALFTENVVALSGFYTRSLGAEPVFQNEGMALFQVDGLQLLIHHKAPPDPAYTVDADGPPNEDHIALAVPDLDAACAELEGQGLTIALPAQSFPWGRSAYLRDPDGRLIELSERA